MKIWQRVFLTSLLIVTFSVPLGGMMIINNQLHTQIDREVDNSKAYHKQLFNSIRIRVNGACNTEEDGLSYQKVMLLNSQYKEIIDSLISEEMDSDFGLKIVWDKTLARTNGNYHTITENEEELFSLYETKYEILSPRETHYLLMGTKTTVDGHEVEMISGMDVTFIYNAYKSQVSTLGKMSAVIGLISGFALIILIRMMLSPIKKLQETVHKIADGDYEQIIEVAGNDEITELAGDVNIMAERIRENITKLDEVAESRQMFIGNMAHEMKTPLTGILGFADILAINPNLTKEQVHEYSEYIYREATRLRGMSGKLLELVSLQENSVVTEVVSLKEIVEEVIETERIILEKENIGLKDKLCECNINADADLIKSLLYNLLDNANKVTKPGGVIEIRMRIAHEKVMVQVRDYGIGISSEEISKIIEPFYMVDKSRSRQSGGTGLGLALCNKIAVLHNGKLEIQSEPGEGTDVMVTFPIVQ